VIVLDRKIDEAVGSEMEKKRSPTLYRD